MAGVHDHTELDVWKLCDEFRRRARELLKVPALRRDRDLHDQLKRSSEAPPPLIAEGFARYLPKDFARYLRIARGSVAEAMDHIDSAAEQQMIGGTFVEETQIIGRRARRATTGLINYLAKAKAPDDWSGRRKTHPARRRHRDVPDRGNGNPDRGNPEPGNPEPEPEEPEPENPEPGT